MRAFRPKLPKARPQHRATMMELLQRQGYRFFGLAGKTNRELAQMVNRTETHGLSAIGKLEAQKHKHQIRTSPY